MFMEIAIGAIGIGIVLMVGYLVVAQVRAALPTDTGDVQVVNPCVGQVGISATGDCVSADNITYTAEVCGTTNLSSSNASGIISCPNVGVTEGMSGTQVTVFAGFGLLAVGIIVLAAFGLINIFK